MKPKYKVEMIGSFVFPNAMENRLNFLWEQGWAFVCFVGDVNCSAVFIWKGE